MENHRIKRLRNPLNKWKPRTYQTLTPSKNLPSIIVHTDNTAGSIAPKQKLSTRTIELYAKTKDRPIPTSKRKTIPISD